VRSIKLPSWTERLLGLDAQPAPPWVFGISWDSLRLARLDRPEEGPPRLVDAREIPLPADTFQTGPLGGPLRAPEALHEAILAAIEPYEEVSEASLVLPDRWVRSVLAELETMPRAEDERQKVLRWKLGRLVPFRVEELRVQAEPVPPVVAGDAERVLITFAMERLLGELEAAFADAGIQVGRIVSESLASVAALDPASLGDDLVLLVDAQPSDYVLVLLRGRTPLLWRYKTIEGAMPRDDLARLVRRELALTAGFLDHRLEDTRIQRALLLASPASAADWLPWLEDAIGVAELIEPRHLGARSEPGVERVAPLIGAGLEEVA
jgi:hypothetical protein